MRGRSWFREFIHHFILIVLFAAGLYFVWKRVMFTPELAAIGWLRWLLYASAVVLGVLLIVFVNSVLSSNYLERFDPGKPGSLERLDRIRRFRLKPEEAKRLKEWDEPILQIAHILRQDGYQEIARWTFGIVYEKERSRGLFKRHQEIDRFFLYYKPMLNVLIIDHVLKECMGYISKLSDKQPAPRNILLFVTDMTDRAEVTSSAAGVVNFLGRIDEGSLGPMLLDLCFGRLFYSLDRSLIPFRHRKFQDRLRGVIVRHILSDRALRRGERFERPSDTITMRKVQLSVELPEPEVTEERVVRPAPPKRVRKARIELSPDSIRDGTDNIPEMNDAK
jgi:hypothetical protein